MPSSDLLHFFKAWIADPKYVGAIAPSGNALAEVITSEISRTSGPVLELGPGTGVFTEALLNKGLRQEELTLIEYGSDFARLLHHRFPRARVLWMDASRLAHHGLFEGAPLGAVVSGIPLLNLPPRKIIRILSGSFRYMRPGAAFYQFTYGPRCPISRPMLDRLGLKASPVGRAIANVPPASVYPITGRGVRLPI
ncbi:class I SAM-dependent methyltransferase [Microvirga terricola]|uniref:SAM-dependent methyltransferase n=1 Tax=Microvirga terricola TaxID=2719797 RepID=A0ABX0VES0_9HYPH|nr:rRNA adenine N-6-methyltransferase family protein [Microvirga terricola]NIX78339.1 SAM-dependent methyltransferase [Microvirga terricola]